MEAEEYKEKIEELILEIVKKIYMRTLENEIGHSHLDKKRIDGNKDFENGENSEREYVLKNINWELEQASKFELLIFRTMFLLKRDIDKIKELNKTEEKNGN